MKKHIERIKEQGVEHSNKMAMILAGITTVVIVIIWIVLALVVNKKEEEPTPINNLNISEFLQQAEESVSQLGEEFQSGREGINETLEEINTLREAESDQDYEN